MKSVSYKPLIIVLLVVGIVVLSFQQKEPVKDIPRDIHWSLASVEQADVEITTLDDGRIHIVIVHPLLKDIEPQMVSWFYRVLPITRVKYRGGEVPLYHLFHPSEHGQIWLEESATDQLPGMGVGALVKRFEWFEQYQSSGAGRLVKFDEQGMTALPEVQGIHPGKIEHVFTAEGDDTLYQVNSTIGFDTPVIGPVINWFIRRFVFPRDKIEQWVRHQVEEVSSMQYLIPALYPKYHERLELPMVFELAID